MRQCCSRHADKYSCHYKYFYDDKDIDLDLHADPECNSLLVAYKYNYHYQNMDTFVYSQCYSIHITNTCIYRNMDSLYDAFIHLHQNTDRNAVRNRNKHRFAFAHRYAAGQPDRYGIAHVYTDGVFHNRVKPRFHSYTHIYRNTYRYAGKYVHPYPHAYCDHEPDCHADSDGFAAVNVYRIPDLNPDVYAFIYADGYGHGPANGDTDRYVHGDDDAGIQRFRDRYSSPYNNFHADDHGNHIVPNAHGNARGREHF